MKCLVCKQMFLKNVQKISKTKKTIMPKTCPGCRKLAPRASMRNQNPVRK